MEAAFLLPATGDCLIFLGGEKCDDVRSNFGEGLTIWGDGPDGEFEFSCPQFHVTTHSRAWEKPAWAIASPQNERSTITYRLGSQPAKVVAVINDFDFEYGNVSADLTGNLRGRPLRVDAAGRAVDFTWREGREQLRRLLDIGTLRSTALATFSFAAWDGASEEELVSFADDVASLCGIAVRRHTGVPLLTFVDEAGRVVKRVISNPIESDFRPRCVLLDLHLSDGLPRLFRECFDEHRRMQQSDLWRSVPFIFASVEDSTYLEQKVASLMASLEYLIRNSLLEEGSLRREEIESKTFPELIGAARRTLRWDIPKHYTASERHRHLRNAVAHGHALPEDTVDVRQNFDKWVLFLSRRLLMRLGYTGKVASPRNGCRASSPVGDFTEEHNGFRSLASATT